MTEHTLFEEWDGVLQLWAGRQILQGQEYAGWPSKFWPPLYPLLVGILDVFLEGHTAGKIVSFFSSFLMLIFTYGICKSLGCNEWYAILGQFTLASIPLFMVSSIQVENHMLDSMLYVGSIYFMISYVENSSKNKIVLAGIFSGLACMTRYTSYSIILSVFLLYILYYTFKNNSNKEISGDVLKYALYFSVTSSVWWFFNMIENGSPIYNWNYLNIGAEVYPGGADEFWWHSQVFVSSTIDIILKYPKEYLSNIYLNIIETANLINNVKLVGVSAFISIPSILYTIIDRRYQGLILFANVLVYVMVVSQAKVFGPIFLAWSAILTCTYIKSAQDYVLSSDVINYPISMVILYLIPSVLFVFSINNTMDYVMEDNDYISKDKDVGLLTCRKKVTNRLKKFDEEIKNKTIMSVHPARAYYLGSNWMMFPTHYTGSATGLVEYKNLSKKVIEYAPKKPLSTEQHSLRSDYLIFDGKSKDYIPHLSFLSNPKSNKLPPSFSLVMKCKNVYVYDV
ncbi:putative membrane protein [Salinibacter ruber]|nr:glycosyltransferase family 39 protein [Salinibacter ruber]MCS4174456.1 putative membrane protein [Salinibacter ruber]